MTAFLDRRVTVLLAAALAACSPVLDWREVRVDGGSLAGLFPCRPEHRVRFVPLVGDRYRMEMATCAAGDSTYAVSYFDVADPATVTQALAALRVAAIENVGATLPRITSLSLRGMTPNAEAARLGAEGRLPDGRAVLMHAVFFVKGLRIYQASVVGAMPAPEAVEPFLAGLTFLP